MNDGKDTRSFFRKVVNFVVNPRGDGADSVLPDDEEARESEFAKSELKGMIERKRRNDFVRKRELDLLRKLRREGLTPEQLAALGSSSGMADTQTRSDEAELSAHPDMKERINEIEQQMSNHAPPLAARRAPEPPLNTAPGQPEGMGVLERSMADTIIDAAQLDDPPAARPLALSVPPQPARPGAEVAQRASPPNSGFDMPLMRTAGTQDAVEVTEVGHDPELDEAVISYANGDSAAAETLLRSLIGAGGSRRQHSDTWMVVFDLYRGTGQQAKFEALAHEYAERFHQSAPHWFSVPKMVAEAAAHARPPAPPADLLVTWTCAPDLDAAVVDGLRARVQIASLPWVFDWTALQRIDDEAVGPLLDLARQWVARDLEMRWIGGEILMTLLAATTPVGVPQVDQGWWQLRLQLLRLVNRPTVFDEVAIDYCVTYEISPPSWEPSPCRVRISGPVGTRSNLTTIIGEANTSFIESEFADEPGLIQMVSLELAGQMVGDVDAVLRKLDAEIGEAKLIELSCIKLLRVDFMASGELLNWVLAHNRDQRSVRFVDTNRLVARFFSAIGIDAYATVKVRTV
ncbi:MAG: hypothetical protein ABI564_09430 [Ideonella sp.]